jgi:hypothetical protein
VRLGTAFPVPGCHSCETGGYSEGYEIGRPKPSRHRIDQTGTAFRLAPTRSETPSDSLPVLAPDLALLASCRVGVAAPPDAAAQFEKAVLADTLVLWGGEFGRAPVAQGTDGRTSNTTSPVLSLRIFTSAVAPGPVPAARSGTPSPVSSATVTHTPPAVPGVRGRTWRRC